VYITEGSANELKGVTFALVCVNKGSARSKIFDLLIRLNIPFIDVGKRAFKDSMKPFSHGLPGVIWAVFVPTVVIHSCAALASNSGP
jgi:hypothetical protein